MVKAVTLSLRPVQQSYHGKLQFRGKRKYKLRKAMYISIGGGGGGGGASQ